MRCPLCPHRCALKEGGPAGLCCARALRDGRIIPLNYGLVTSLALDPIEKKPLYTFHPGSKVLSLGSFGCNMSCFFCQNHGISMAGKEDSGYEAMAPESLVDAALSLVPKGNIGLAFTYNEPLIGWEFVLDAAKLLREAGLLSVAVTNGCFSLEEIEPLFTYIDAFNIDLKGFTQGWYGRLGGDLETVKRFIARAVESAHVELTTLAVPGENDSPEEIEALAAWVASLSPDIPLHLSRFFPRYKALDKPPTDKGALLRLCDAARRHLRHVYPGNI